MSIAVMSTRKSIVSPSRTYVAICNKTNFDGHYMKKFTIPERNLFDAHYENNTDNASWYFLNILDHIACVEKVITFEDYSNIKDAN